MATSLSPGIRLVVLSSALINFGTYGVAPFLAVLMLRLHYSPIEVALVLGANLVAARLVPLAAGLLGDRLAHVRVMIVSLVIRGAGLAGFAAHDDFWWFIVCSALVGLGGAGYEPNAYAVLAHEADEEVRARGYALLNLGQNIGATAGPVAGGVLIAFNTDILFLVSGALMVVTAAVFLAYRDRLHTDSTDAPVLSSLRRVFTDRRFLRFGVAMGLFWFIDAQFQTSLPIYATDLSGRVALAGSVLVVNGIAGMLALLALRKQFEKRAALPMNAAGLLVVAVSMAAIALVPELWWLLVCIAVYTIGETLVFVTADVYLAELADTRDAAAFFGGHDVFWAIGGTVGYFVGTALLDAEAGNRAVWLVFAVAALLALAVLGKDLRAGSGAPGKSPSPETAADTPASTVN